MAILRLSTDEDAIVLHFQSERRRINAYTLASTLVAFSDAAKAANAALNPGYDIEVVVEAIGPGSFRVKVRAFIASARNLYSNLKANPWVIGITTGLIVTYLSQSSTVVTINTDEVIIETDGDRIVIPRKLYEDIRSAEQNPEVRKATARIVHAITTDAEVTGIGFVREMNDVPPDVVIPRSRLLDAVRQLEDEGPDGRTVVEPAELGIRKAILEWNRRSKWQFIWRGFKISAPMLDADFYARFEARQVTIAPGDALSVRLRIKQKRDPATGIFTNESYDVVEVLNHIPAIGNQGTFGEGDKLE